ncbi:WD_REPEATS_REGION domain-containing protein [Tenacibaculum sp. 190524A02b]|uniref:WD_REPEATS_REGION domain-containing protein n=1 Tax=Tenacibaculum vairaonense TaxID=3137860 RepID=A0ABP1FA31_9FLAO
MKKVINLLPNSERYCFLIESAFDKEFCEGIIYNTEQTFNKSNTHYPVSYRNNERQLLDDSNLSNDLFESIKNYIPKTIMIDGISSKEKGTWNLEELNSRIRICRYLPNQYFNKHLDGVHYVSNEKQSKLTFMIYLNASDSFKGDRTLFFKSKEDDEVLVSYVPKQGDLIVFDHNLWHSGEVVTEGIKYVLRSDILYKNIESNSNVDNIDFTEGHLGYIWQIIKFNNLLITSGRDKKVKVWNKKGKKITEFVGHENSITCLLTLNKTIVVSASRDTSIKIWKVDNREKFEHIKTIDTHKGTVLSLCAINETTFFSAGADGYVYRVTSEGVVLGKFIAHKSWIWQVSIVENKYLASIGEDGIFNLWQITNYKNVNSFQVEVPINSITYVDGTFYLGLFNGEIKVLSFQKKSKEFKEVSTKKCHEGIIRKIKVKGDYIYSASEDNTLKIWNRNNFSLIKTIKHKNFVQDFVVYTNSVITVSYDGQIKKSNSN